MLTLLRSDIFTALIDSGHGSANSYGNSAEIEVVCGPLLDCGPPILAKKEKGHRIKLTPNSKLELKGSRVTEQFCNCENFDFKPSTPWIF